MWNEAEAVNPARLCSSSVTFPFSTVCVAVYMSVCQHLQTESINNFPDRSPTLCCKRLNRLKNQFWRCIRGSSKRGSRSPRHCIRARWKCVSSVCVWKYASGSVSPASPRFLSPPVTQAVHHCRPTKSSISLLLPLISHPLPFPFSRGLCPLLLRAIHDSPSSPSVTSDSASVSSRRRFSLRSLSPSNAARAAGFV